MDVSMASWSPCRSTTTHLSRITGVRAQTDSAVLVKAKLTEPATKSKGFGRILAFPEHSCPADRAQQLVEVGAELVHRLVRDRPSG